MFSTKHHIPSHFFLDNNTMAKLPKYILKSTGVVAGRKPCYFLILILDIFCDTVYA